MDAMLTPVAASLAPLAGALWAGWTASILPPEALGLLAGSVAAMGPAVLSITDIFDGDDDEESDDEEAVFEDDDDLGDLGEFDDVDGLDDDASLGGGGDGQSVNELENRVEELENEVASLSSSVNTVQNENEAVSETVQEVEENVRDLLEIYEMVTRGVNPFVDDTTSGAMGGGSDGTFGLFDDDGDEEAGDVDESIAEADAEEFFEDDFDEPDESELATPDEAAVASDEDPLDEDDGAGFDDEELAGGDEDDSGDDGDGEGKSFAELKEEYESGEAGWDVDDPLEEAQDDDDGAEQTPSSDVASDDEEESAAGEDGDGVIGDEQAGGEFDFDSGPAADREATDADHDGSEFEFVGQRGAEPASTSDGPDDASQSDDAGLEDRIHLREFPEGYLADLTALEWLEYLIDVGGTEGARDALSYYVDVGWISPAVEAELRAFLDGIRESDTGQPPAGSGGLGRFDPGDHRRSLAFVAKLAGDGDRAALFDRVQGDVPVESVTPDGAGGGRPTTGGDDDGL